MRFAVALSLLIAATCTGAEPAVDFNRDVRPILSNHCFKCHGPAVQKSGVRLDSLEHAKKKGAIEPGKAAASAMIDRIVSKDDGERMPPAEAGKPLTEAQIKTLKKWIEQGANYDKHWSFVPPVKAELPKGQVEKYSNPIDAFVRAELEKRKIEPSKSADKSTLIRRVYLDLVGLLPSPAEVDAFLKDDSPEGYSKLVEKLLASPHYGERQARHWLDLARYADSNGYTVDGARSIWPYRDWVIDAFNKDMPFDQFTIEQLAGDLLPKPTKEQLIATGFHRNTAFNEEGGADPEQFRVERTIDRTNTTAAVWLGLTFNCSQCHDHKYDPISQKDYYRLYAFFNSCDEPSLTVGGSPELDQKVNDLMEQSKSLKAEGKLDEGKKVDAEIKKVQGKIPTTLILRERKEPRETHVQIRGDFLRKGDPVQPSYPTAIAKPSSDKLNRLDLAKWLVSKENPITARVVVNRAWQQFFGAGLVETENDFGMQGSAPSHPELLDWLAIQFQAPLSLGGRGVGGEGELKPWSLKALHRLIVTSETYKQSSVARKELLELDPKNRLLAKQNRLRLEAEIIRDAALSASGLLCEKIGGPGVYPPLPPEVFAFTQSKQAWKESQGEDRYRRGMYTFLWRQSQHHLLTTFDAADAQVACTRRNRSNTPLQALHLANDPAFVEFFEVLGRRIVKDGPADTAGRIDWVFKICFARLPNETERGRLMRYFESQKGDETKKWIALARVLMNLDEFVTRE